MEKESTIIGLGIIALVLIPFIISYIIKKAKKTKFRKTFMSAAGKENIKISDHEMWEHRYMIGIDQDGKKLIYLKRNDNDVAPVVIDLSNVMKCRIVSTYRDQKSQFGDKERTNRLDLVLTVNNNTNAEKSLEFYNNPEFMPSSDAYAIVKKWSDIISENLKQA